MNDNFMTVILEKDTDRYEIILYKRIVYTHYSEHGGYGNDWETLDRKHRSNKPIPSDIIPTPTSSNYTVNYSSYTLENAIDWSSKNSSETIIIKKDNIEEINITTHNDKFFIIECETNILIPGTNVKRRFNLLTSDRILELRGHESFRYTYGDIVKVHSQNDSIFVKEFTSPDGKKSREPFLDPYLKDILIKGLIGLGVIYLIIKIFS